MDILVNDILVNSIYGLFLIHDNLTSFINGLNNLLEDYQYNNINQIIDCLSKLYKKHRTKHLQTLPDNLRAEEIDKYHTISQLFNLMLVNKQFKTKYQKKYRKEAVEELKKGLKNEFNKANTLENNFEILIKYKEKGVPLDDLLKYINETTIPDEKTRSNLMFKLIRVECLKGVPLDDLLNKYINNFKRIIPDKRLRSHLVRELILYERIYIKKIPLDVLMKYINETTIPDIYIRYNFVKSLIKAEYREGVPLDVLMKNINETTIPDERLRSDLVYDLIREEYSNRNVRLDDMMKYINERTIPDEDKRSFLVSKIIRNEYYEKNVPLDDLMKYINETTIPDEERRSKLVKDLNI